MENEFRGRHISINRDLVQYYSFIYTIKATFRYAFSKKNMLVFLCKIDLGIQNKIYIKY